MRCGDRPFFSVFATGMCPVIGAIAIFKRVPAEICENYGEYYLSDAVTGELLERTENVTKSACFCH